MTFIRILLFVLLVPVGVICGIIYGALYIPVEFGYAILSGKWFED